MPTLKTVIILTFALLVTITSYGQDAVVSFRTGQVGGPWCPILGPDSNPLPEGSFIGIYSTGPDNLVDPPSSDPLTCGEPTGDDIRAINNSIGNGLDYLMMMYDEPPYVPNGNLFMANGAVVIPPAGSGTEPLVNIGDVMYLRAFNSDHYSTATHYNDLLTVDSVAQNTYSCTNPGAATVIVCFTDAIDLGCVPAPCVAQEVAGPEGPVVINPGMTHYFFGETEDSHCTLWITTMINPVTVTATVYDQQPPCKPFPTVNYMTRYLDLQGSADSWFDLYIGYSQSEYDSSDFGPDETYLEIIWFQGDTTNCDGVWCKVLPTTVFDTDSGGYCHVNTNHLGLWSFEWDDGIISPVPPELISFNASSGDKIVQLNWITESGWFTPGYYVERSTDCVNFFHVSPAIENTFPFGEIEYSYIDQQVKNDVRYYYRIDPISWDNIESFDNWIITAIPTLFGEAAEISNYRLHQNFPNPFNTTTRIVYDIPVTSHVTLKVYNITGQQVATLVDDVKGEGRYVAEFAPANLSSGIYFYTIQANTFSEVRKLLYIR